jgi:hypothetical protein
VTRLRKAAGAAWRPRASNERPFRLHGSTSPRRGFVALETPGGRLAALDLSRSAPRAIAAEHCARRFGEPALTDRPTMAAPHSDGCRPS